MDSNTDAIETPIASDSKMDMRAFFRDTERGLRRFLIQYDRRAKTDQDLNPYRMTKDAWWREFLKWAGKNETR